MKPDAMRHMGRAPYGTRWLEHNKGDPCKPEYRSRLVVQETRRTSTIPPKTARRQARAPHHLWKLSGSSVALPCRCLVWSYNSWMSRERTLIAKCFENMYTSRHRRNLAWNRYSACDSRDAGSGHVTPDKPSSSLCVTTLK